MYLLPLAIAADQARFVAGVTSNDHQLAILEKIERFSSPEDVVIDETSPMRGNVLATEYLGTSQIISVATQSGNLKVRAPSSQIVAVDSQVGLSFKQGALTIFDTQTGKAVLSEANREVLANG